MSLRVPYGDLYVENWGERDIYEPGDVLNCNTRLCEDPIHSQRPFAEVIRHANWIKNNAMYCLFDLNKYLIFVVVPEPY